MNVFILIRRFDFGGAENYVRELANALSDNGNNVFVLSKKGRQCLLLSSRVKFIFIPFSKILLPVNLITLFILARKNRIDVIHANQRSAILAGVLLSKLARIPLIVTIHSTTPLELKSGLTRRTPARIIYVNRHTMERSKWYSMLEPKCRFIPNGIVIRERSLPAEKMRLVYCSRIDKSHAGLLRILIEEVMPQLKTKLPDIDLEIVGDGHMRSLVEQWIEDMNRHLGAQTILLRGFKESFMTDGALVLGVGRVALEALSYGIPVLSVNERRCGPRISDANFEMLRQTNFVAVTAQITDAGLLIDSITEIFENYTTVINESRHLREKVKTELSLSSMVKKIEQEYREAINETLRFKLQRKRFARLQYKMEEIDS